MILFEMKRMERTWNILIISERTFRSNIILPVLFQTIFPECSLIPTPRSEGRSGPFPERSMFHRHLLAPSAAALHLIWAATHERPCRLAPPSASQLASLLIKLFASSSTAAHIQVKQHLRQYSAV
jgi:hypothetical protein